MMNTMGIALDTWADIDGDCSMSYCEVTRSDAQIVVGHGSGSLHLVMTEGGLVRLADVVSKALKEVQEAAHGCQ